jgi:hypothetical protein
VLAGHGDDEVGPRQQFPGHAPASVARHVEPPTPQDFDAQAGGRLAPFDEAGGVHMGLDAKVGQAGAQKHLGDR